MAKYLYVFYFESPEMHKHNIEKDDDLNIGEAFYILATNELEALAWGEKLADEYVRIYCNDRSLSFKKLDPYNVERIENPANWRKSFDHGERGDALYKQAIALVTEVNVGEIPDMAGLIRARFGDMPWFKYEFPHLVSSSS